MNKRIYLSSPTMHGLEMGYIQEAFDTNWGAPLDKNVDEFEKEIASLVGVNNAVALESGTAAIHLAVKLCNVKPGDLVFCSDLTFAATVNPISYEGGLQVFIDSELDTWNMDPIALEKAFTKYPHPKAVILVHLFGTPAKIDEIKEICEFHKVPLIEDAAESLGSTYKGKHTGSFGKYSILSFNGNKIITTSGGGMFLSNDFEAARKVRYLATQLIDSASHYQHSEIGYNYRMSNIIAGIGRGQLSYLQEHINNKKRIYENYKEAFKELPITMNPHLEDSDPNYWLSCLMIDEKCKVTYKDILDRLEENNIESRPIWKPMHLQPIFKHCNFITNDSLDVSNFIFSKGLCLPSDIKLTEEEQNMIIEIIKDCFR